MTSLAITVVGHDQPGIIARTAAVLADFGMNLEDSSMTRLRGQFAMTLICAGTASADQLRQALEPLASSRLSVSVQPVSGDAEPPQSAISYLLTVHGADRLGIVARLANVLADARGNITDLTTRLSGELYVVLAEVDLPTGADVAALRDQLVGVAAELGVEAHLRRLDNDDL